MLDGILLATGGLGLFLLGMVVMTNGLQALAADALGRALRRFTKSPLSGAATGAVAKVIQSSWSVCCSSSSASRASPTSATRSPASP